MTNEELQKKLTTARTALEEVEPLIDAQFEGHDGVAEFQEKVRKLNRALDIVRAAIAATSS